MNTPAQEFPNYPDWLASHSDEAIADLLWRLYAHGSTSLLEQLSGTASPEPALHHLNALELAILHAATEIGASSSPVSVEELTETLAELFDIAGTPEKRRPGGIDIYSGLLSLANWGLGFGPRFTLTTSLRTSSASPHLSRPNCSATDSNTDTALTSGVCGESCVESCARCRGILLPAIPVLASFQIESSGSGSCGESFTRSFTEEECYSRFTARQFTKTKGD